MLQSIKTNATGTVRFNRKNMLKELATAKLKRSEVISKSCNGILTAKWKDEEDIYLLSTKHMPWVGWIYKIVTCLLFH